MKKIFAIIAIVMMACLSLTGLLATDYVAVAEGETDFSKSVVAKMPSSNTYQGTTYYGIKTIEEWKWVFDNIDEINIRQNTLVIENNLDFSKYTNIPSLDYGSRQGDVTGSTSPMRFSIVGGKIDNSTGTVKINNFIPTITGYSIKIDKRNLGFMNMFDGEIIKNLKFDSMKFTYAGKSTDQVGGPLGGLVGTLLSGTIENVSFTNADLNVVNFNGVVGGVVGKVINGTISATDFQGNIIATATNARVGGMVGEIIMGEIDYTGNHNVNDVKIRDSYVVANIEGGKYAGGIIGNIGYTIYPGFDTLTSLANITVQNVYAKLKKITVADTKGEPYGILGNANIEKEEVVLPPTGQEATPSTIVPIANVKFTNIISPDTTESKALTQMPINFPNAQVTNGKAMPNEDFAISANYSGFELGKVWIMPEANDAANQQLDLIYKYESKQVKAVIAGTPAGSSIAELSNEIVSFVKDSPIVMTMQPKDGVHLLKAKILLKGKDSQVVEIMLYEAKPFAEQTFNTAEEFFNYYGKDEETVKYDYKNAKLTIPVTVNADTQEKEYLVQGADGQKYNLFEKDGDQFKYDVTFEFYFADEQKVEAINEYKISTEPVFLTDNKPTNLGDVVLMEQVNTGNNDTATAQPNGTKYMHNKDIYVFVPENYKSDMSGLNLEGVKVKSNAGEEFLTNEQGRGWTQIYSDFSYNKKDDGTIVKGTLYKVQLNYLKNKLYDKDSVMLQFVFNGNELGESLRFQVGKDGDDAKELVYNDILSVQYIDEEGQQVLKPRVYDSLTIKFTLGTKGKQGKYAFNLMNFTDKKLYITANYRKNSDDKVGTDKTYEVTYDEATQTFTTTTPVSFEALTTIYVKVVQTVQNTVGLTGVTFNPPSLKLYNIPILGKDGINVVGFATATLLYSDKDGVRKLVVSTEADQNFGDVDISDIVKVGANGQVAEFTSIQGANIGVEVVKNTVDQTDADKYYKLDAYKLNGMDYTFTYYEGFPTIGKIDMAGKTTTNTINIQFKTEDQIITLMPYVKDEAGNMVPLDKNKDEKPVQYGSQFNFNRSDHVAGYEKDYIFDGWLMGSEGDPVIKDSFSGRADGPKEVRIILTPKVGITFEANKNFGSILLDGNKITTFEFDKRLYNDTDKKLVFKVELLRGKKLSVAENEQYTYDAKTQTITINIAALPALNQTNLDSGLLDIKVPLTFSDITLQFSVTNKHLDDKGNGIGEKGGITTIYDGNQYEIGSYDPTYTDNDLKFDSRMYIEATVNTGYSVTFYINDVVADSNLISKIENKYTLKMPEMTENTAITVEYKKSPEQTFYKIVSEKIELGHLEGDRFVKDSELYGVDIRFAFNVTGGNIDKKNIPHGTEVIVTFSGLENKYEFYSWFNGKEGQPTETKDLIYKIAAIDDNYEITLRVVEKTYKVEVLMPELSSGDTATVTIRKPDGTTENIPNSHVKYELVAKYGESVSLFFNPNINENYEIDRWVVSGDANPSTAQTYTLSVKDDYVIRVQVKKKKANVDIITDDLKIKHDMSYTGFATGYTKALLFEGNTKVKLTALPSSDAYFEKWIVKDADGVRDYSKDAEIVVANEEGKTYEAVFQIKKYKITFVNQDVYAPIFKGENPDSISHGKNIRIEFKVMAGYKIDKIIINGGEQVIPIGSVNAIDLYNIDKDQTIQVLYHKVDMTDSDKTMVTVAVIMLIVAIVVAIIVYILLVNSSIKQARKKRKDKSNRINVD